MNSHELLATGDRAVIKAGVYKGRSGIVRSVGKYWHEVKPDQSGVGGLNSRGCMVVGVNDIDARQKLPRQKLPKESFA